MLEYKIDKIEQIESTTNEVKRLAKSGEIKPGYVLVSQAQTAGHGQFGRVFESPLGGLYMSIFIQKKLPFETDGFTTKIGRILQKSIKNSTGIDTEIKEPNDILHNGKKICGILVESFTLNGNLNIVIGIGLNLNTNPKDFSKEIASLANSVFNITNKKTDPDLMIGSILENLREIE